MKLEPIKTYGPMVCYSIRLHRGDDLLSSIQSIAKQHNIQGAVVLSSVGCILNGKVRDASGITIRTIDEPCEIISLNGTVSASRCHLHIAFSKEDLSTIGGHLVEGCIINTTCELVIAELPHISFGIEQDEETGYDEIVFQETKSE